MASGGKPEVEISAYHPKVKDSSLASGTDSFTENISKTSSRMASVGTW
jgi:hypothetical protein